VICLKPLLRVRTGMPGQYVSVVLSIFAMWFASCSGVGASMRTRLVIFAGGLAIALFGVVLPSVHEHARRARKPSSP